MVYPQNERTSFHFGKGAEKKGIGSVKKDKKKKCGLRRKERQNSFPHRRRKVSFPDYCGFAQRVWLHRYAILKRYPEGPFFFFSSSHTPIPCRHRRKAFAIPLKMCIKTKSKMLFLGESHTFQCLLPLCSTRLPSWKRYT